VLKSEKLIQISIVVSMFAMAGCTVVNESPALPVSDDAPPAAQPQLISGPMVSEEKIAEEEVINAVAGSFPPELLFRLLAAEIAAQRGNNVLAANEYTSAAFEMREVKLVEQAMRYSALRGDADLQEVSQLAQLWVELAPDETSAHQAVAMVQLQRGDSATAVEKLEYLLANFETFDFNTVITLLSRQPGKVLALSVMQQLADKRPDNAEAQFAYAHLAMRFSDTEQALLASERVMALRPNWSNAINLHARLLQMLDRGDEAIALLQDRLAGPLSDDTAMRKTYARMLLRNQQVDVAWQQYQLILHQYPEDDSSRYLYAIASLELEKTELAKQQLEQLAENGAHQDDARFQLGRLSELSQQLTEALEWYRSVNDGQFVLAARFQEATLLAREGEVGAGLAVLDGLLSDDLNEQLNIAMVKADILLRAERVQHAYQVYSEALQQQPESMPLLYSRAMVADRLGDYVAAEKDLQAILSADIDNVDALNGLGYNLAQRNIRLDEALAYLQRAYELKPNNGPITDSLGWVYYRLGDYEKAHHYLRQALELEYDTEIAAHLGEVLWVTGEHERARHVWQKALERDPKHPVLLETIERLDP